MPAVRAVEPAELVDDQLARRAAQVVSLGEDRLSYFDDQRQLQQVATGDFVALQFTRPMAAEVADDAPGLLQLTDGQRLSGKFAGVSEDGKLQWATQSFGTQGFALDRVAIFAVVEKPVAVKADDDQATDKVILSNGDVVHGFVQSLMKDGLIIQIDQNPLKLDWPKVSRIVLPNVGGKRLPGNWLRLTDGSRLLVEGLTVEGQKVTGKVLGGLAMEVPLAQVSAVDFAKRFRLVRLADVPHKVTSGGEVFGVKWEPRFTAADVRVHAPVAVRFDLPEGSVRLAMTAEVEPQSLDWADMTLSLTEDGQTLATEKLSGEHASAAVSAAVKGGSVTVTLGEAANGPVRDRLTLRNAVVLVKILK